MNKRMIRSCFIVLALASAFLFFPSINQAASVDYPTRPIEVVVHTAPGGLVDIVPRIVNPILSEILGVPLIIQNKPAGSGAAGIESVIKAKPDGYTILSVSENALTLLPLINPDLSFTYKNLHHIAFCAFGPNVIIVHPDSPFKTLQELLDFAKSNPGKLTYGSTGAAHVSRVSMELIIKKAGVQIAHIPYQGGGPLKTAILGKQTDVACDTIAAVSTLIKAGNLRALAVCSDQRFEEFPQVPTTVELGYPNSAFPGYVGYSAPLKTPLPIIDKLDQAIKKTLANPKVADQMKKVSLTVSYKSSDAVNQSFERTNRILSEWVKEAGLSKK